MEGPVAEAYVQSNDNLAIADDVVFEKGTKETAIAISKEAPLLLEKSMLPSRRLSITIY